MKDAGIKEQRASIPVQTMCRVLAVSKSGFCKWLSATPGPRAQRREAITASVRRVYEPSSGIEGSATIRQEQRNSGKLETACRKTVAKAK